MRASGRNESFRADDGWVMIAAGNDSLFGRLCGALAIPELVDDPRFAVAAVRVRHRAELHGLIQVALEGRPRADLLSLLQHAGVPAGPVHDLAEALEHPVASERGVLVHGPGDSVFPQVRLPITDVGSPPYRQPPGLGEHTGEVLREAGFSASEIADIG
jgi:crotonobetainyl-CoA:carnitine CoA-transferase CaiB-like acyl-CoA transferase